MQAEKTKTGCLLFHQNFFEDFRGTYIESYNEEEYQKEIKRHFGKEIKFIQDDFSTSHKYILRGIHGDDITTKLISCQFGKFMIYIVDPKTKTDETFVLSRENANQLLIPSGLGNAHIVLSDWAVFHYKQNAYYAGPEKQFTYRYDAFRNWVPSGITPILSQRDNS